MAVCHSKRGAKLQSTDLSTQATTATLTELLTYETLRIFLDFSLNVQVFTLKDLHTSTFTDTNGHCRQPSLNIQRR
jgi:hypothetical protein